MCRPAHRFSHRLWRSRYRRTGPNNAGKLLGNSVSHLGFGRCQSTPTLQLLADGLVVTTLEGAAATDEALREAIHKTNTAPPS